jgi:hypothetical protein
MGSNLKTVSVDFTPGTPQRIDSFLLPLKALAKDGFKVYSLNMANEVEFPVNEGWDSIGEHLKSNLLQTYAQWPEKNTVVLDIPVGRGKSSSCYDLIQRYSKDERNVVLVLSPFRKLVKKDYDEINGKRKISAFNYESLRDIPADELSDFIGEAVTNRVHIMTVNCLLGNPGEDAFDQSSDKREYLKALYNRCQRMKKRVILFFDEIHEAIYNFEPQFVPNLYKWKPLVDKCFVSSATFTAASYPVIKFIALLTDRHITVASLDRTKLDPKKMSRLHLHIVAEEYSGKNLRPLQYLKGILRSSKGKQVNILTGTKSLADALMAKKDSRGNDNPFYEHLEPFSFNLVTPDTKRDYDPIGNNIGTTFKTGVNIENNPDKKGNVYIIIMPVVKQSSPETIFSDGIPSIIQSIGRLRSGGKIHLFMYEPTHLIEPNPDAIQRYAGEEERKGYLYLSAYKPLKERLPEWFTANKSIAYYDDQYRSIETLKKEYDRYLKGSVNEVIELMEQGGIGYQYPTFEEYLMNKGQRLLVRNDPRYGSDLSSFVLWAALNNQFCNALLHDITYTAKPKREILLNKETAIDTFSGLLSQDVKTSISRLSLSHAIPVLIEDLTHDSEGAELTYLYNERQYSMAKLKALPFVIQQLVSLYVNLRSNGAVKELSKADYILACSLQAGTLPADMRITNRVKSYAMLNKQRMQFVRMIERMMVENDKGEKLIHRKAYESLLDFRIDAIIKTVQSLKETDSLIANSIYPFLPRLSNISDTSRKKEAIYKEFEKCFTNVTSKNKTYNAEKDMYYLIDGQVERTLPEEVMKLNLL